MSNTTPISSGPFTPAIPSPAAISNFPKIVSVAARSDRENGTSNQNASDATCVPQRSAPIHSSADEIVALFTQEAQNLQRQMEQTYTMKLDEEKKKFSDMLEAERMRGRVLEARIAALERELREKWAVHILP